MHFSRAQILYFVVILAFAIIIFRFFYIQVINREYREHAVNNVLRYEVQYPARGDIYARDGSILVQNRDVYDLMVIPRDIQPFDTALLSTILSQPVDRIRSELARANTHSRRLPTVLFKQLSKEAKLQLDERGFPGFYTVYRTVRSYPQKIGGNLLGYVGEVSQQALDRDSYYGLGDYIGKSGMELSYERSLRGDKGVRVNLVDVHGISKGSYADGLYDTLPISGPSIRSTIDLRLQALGEELLRGKVGSIVAIDPSTGEILVMASSPSYDPDELVGLHSGNNYMTLLHNPRKPLFNRAVMSRYPPGSVFKIVNGLIALQEGSLKPSYRYSCEMGYTIGRGVKCHAHNSPLALIEAVQTSCNAYFCHVFRGILDNPKYGGVRGGMDVWERYLRSFGFGRKLNSDFIDELDGFIPSSSFYDTKYNNRWNSMTALSLAIGQGELGCSPLQMANLAATVANRGYYYIPHVVSSIEGRDSIDARFYERHYTDVDSVNFTPIIEGMYRAVNVGGGTALVAHVPGLNICGKTGTAQNPHGADHSTFLCFAPRENPRIAVSVYIEHGRFGASVAAPISSLIVEQYLTDTIKRPYLVDYIKQMQINYPYYDRQQQ